MQKLHSCDCSVSAPAPTTLENEAYLGVNWGKKKNKKPTTMGLQSNTCI